MTFYRPTTNAEAIGMHAVLIVGFDDETQTYDILNSHGPDWGNGDTSECHMHMPLILIFVLNFTVFKFEYNIVLENNIIWMQMMIHVHIYQQLHIMPYLFLNVLYYKSYRIYFHCPSVLIRENQ